MQHEVDSSDGLCVVCGLPGDDEQPCAGCWVEPEQDDDGPTPDGCFYAGVPD